jgi:hypothetical protein
MLGYNNYQNSYENKVEASIVNYVHLRSVHADMDEIYIF